MSYGSTAANISAMLPRSPKMAGSKSLPSLKAHGRTSPKHSDPAFAMDGDDGHLVANPAYRSSAPVISLLTPTRLPIPEVYNCPPRAPDGVGFLKSDAARHKELFDQLKSKSRSHTTLCSISVGRDFEMLATASKRGGDLAKASQALFNLGVSLDNTQQYGKAVEAYRKFLKVAKEAGNVPAQCLGYNSVAISYQNKGDLEAALTYHARHARVAQDARNQSVALCNAGMVQRLLGRLEEARECCRSALEIALNAGDTSMEMLASGLLGITSAVIKTSFTPTAVKGSLEDSGADVGRAALERQLFLQSTVDDPLNRVVAHEQLGLLSSARGEHADDYEHFKRARNFCGRTSDPSRAMLEKCSMGIALANQVMREYFTSIREGVETGKPPGPLQVPDLLAPPSP